MLVWMSPRCARRTRRRIATAEHHRGAMHTVHRAGDRKLVAVKGSPAEVLVLCRRAVLNGDERLLTDADRSGIEHENERLANQACVFSVLLPAG